VSAPDEAPKTARTDAVFALSMIGVALLTMWGLRNQPRAPYDPVGAAAAPFWTAAIVLGLAVLLLIRVLLRHNTRGAAASMFTMSQAVDETYSVRPRLSVYAITLSFLFIAAIPIAGFLFSSIGFMVALGWLLSDRSRRALALVAAVAIVGAVGLDLGFRALLIDLP
jgi:Tripartite tricarboxylate transporter TctB family